MLDEIINYVQSLQRQVEVISDITVQCDSVLHGLVHFSLLKLWHLFQFLSMKLAHVNPMLDFNMEALLSKNVSREFENNELVLVITDRTFHLKLASFGNSDTPIAWIFATNSASIGLIGSICIYVWSPASNGTPAGRRL